MSSLIPERPLQFSPGLAATIGLEEAVLLHVLGDIALFQAATHSEGRRWFQISQDELQMLLPFWDAIALARICKSLRDKGILQLDCPPLTQSPQLRFSLEQSSRKSAVAITPPAPLPTRGASLLSPQWTPDEDLLQLLALNHGIGRDFALAQLDDFLLYWRERGEVAHAWPSKFRQHVLREWRHQQSRDSQDTARSTALPSTQQALDSGWQPSGDALQILQRAGVNAQFIEDAIPEFVLYWRERGEANGTWNSKFIAHIRRQWAKFSASLGNDYEPRPIPANWQPSEDVFDILRLANIELAFARALVPEFVLFWRDTGEAQRSWNTRFLQHAKYQWAARHQLAARLPGAGDGSEHQPGRAQDGSLLRRLTDRSWAKGLVEGI